MVKLCLDFGCGPNPREGFEGVDQYPFDGKVKHVCDLTDPRSWERWETDSVDEAHASHFVEHLEPEERTLFFNEVWRILKPGAQVTIITPFWASGRAYGDLTHKWPPVSEMFYFYLNRDWRKVNSPHYDFDTVGVGFKCHLTGKWGYAPHEELKTRNPEYGQFAVQWYKEAAQDLHATLTKE